MDGQDGLDSRKLLPPFLRRRETKEDGSPSPHMHRDDSSPLHLRPTWPTYLLPSRICTSKVAHTSKQVDELMTFKLAPSRVEIHTSMSCLAPCLPASFAPLVSTVCLFRVLTTHNIPIQYPESQIPRFRFRVRHDHLHALTCIESWSQGVWIPLSMTTCAIYASASRTSD